MHATTTFALILSAVVHVTKSAVGGTDYSWCFFYSPSTCTCTENALGKLSLDCTDKNLSMIPEIPDDSAWQRIDLSRNPLGKLNRYEFIAIIVSELELSYCKINSIHEKTFLMSKGIEHLSLAHNEISQLPASIGNHLSRLKTLDLSYNPLPVGNLADFLRLRQSTLQSLTLDGLAMSRAGLDLSILSNLTNLSIRNASLLNFPCSTVSANTIRLGSTIENLQLAHNNLSALCEDRNVFVDLAILNVSHNRIKQLPSYLSWNNARILDFSHNDIELVPGKMFAELPSLATMNLTRNRLHAISPKFLCGSALKTLDLSFNNISRFPICALAAKSYKSAANLTRRLARRRTIDLRGNWIECDCETNSTLLWATLPPSLCRNSTHNGTVSRPCNRTVSCTVDPCTLPDDEGDFRLSVLVQDLRSCSLMAYGSRTVSTLSAAAVVLAWHHAVKT